MRALFWAVLAAGVLTQLALLFHSRPALALATVFPVSIVSFWLPTSFYLSIGSIQLYPADLLVLALLGATVFGLVTRRSSTPAGRMWCVLVVLLAIAAGRGVLVYGADEAGNAMRGHLHFFAVALFCSTTPWREESMNTLYRCWMVAAAVLLGVAFLFWVGNGVGGFAVEERALTSGPALVLGQATLMSIAAGRSTAFTRFLAPVGLLSVLLVQQRTVWVVVAVSLGAIALLNVGSDTGVRRARILIAAGAGFLVLVLVAGPAGLGQGLDRAVKEPTGEQSTFAWRVEGWQLLVGRRADAPAFDLLAGDPAGTGFERRIGRSITEVSPHNYYVAVLNSFGVVGLAALVLGYLGMIKRLSTFTRRFRPESNDAAVLLVLVLGQLIYFLGYGASMEQGILTGFAGALAWRVGGRSVPEGDREPVRQH